MDPIKIKLRAPEQRRVFHDNDRVWSAIWRCRLNSGVFYDHVGLGDWHLDHHTQASVPVDARGSRHDRPVISSQHYTTTPARLIVCDMPYTGADPLDTTDYRSNITRMARFTRSSYMESRGNATIDIHCWLSSSLYYVYVQLNIVGALLFPSPPLTRVQIPVAEVLDQDGQQNNTPRYCWSHNGAPLPGRGVTPYLFRDMPQANNWTDQYSLNGVQADEVLRHNHVWMPQHVTCWNQAADAGWA